MPRVHDNGLMKVTRRSLAQMLALAVAAPQAGNSQPASDADLDAARDQLRSNLAQIGKVKLPMAIEPACHFKA
jgi:hypothetical protein